MHPLFASHTHRRVGSNGWWTACWCRVDFTQGRSKPRSRCWVVRWHGQAREASGATDAEAKRLGRRKSESASFYALLIKRKKKITLIDAVDLGCVTLHMIASNRLSIITNIPRRAIDNDRAFVNCSATDELWLVPRAFPDRYMYPCRACVDDHQPCSQFVSRAETVRWARG